jgi:hypothetical protein
VSKRERDRDTRGVRSGRCAVKREKEKANGYLNQGRGERERERGGRRGGEEGDGE